MYAFGVSFSEPERSEAWDHIFFLCSLQYKPPILSGKLKFGCLSPRAAQARVHFVHAEGINISKY